MLVDLQKLDDVALKGLFLALMDRVDVRDFLEYFKDAFNENINNAMQGLYLDNFVLYQEHSKGVSRLQDGYKDLLLS